MFEKRFPLPAVIISALLTATGCTTGNSNTSYGYHGNAEHSSLPDAVIDGMYADGNEVLYDNGMLHHDGSGYRFGLRPMRVPGAWNYQREWH